MRTCSCEACSCLELCLETVPWTLLGNRFWEPYLQAVPKNLALLGNLFLDTCLGASFWKLAWERFPPSVRKLSLGSAATPRTRFPIKFSRNRFASKVTRKIPKPGSQVPKQGSWEQISKQGSQDQVPRQGSQEQVHKQGFQEQCLKFPSKGSKNRFPCRVARLPSKVLGNRFPSKVSTNRQASKEQVPKQGFKEKVPKNWFGFQEQIR